MASVSCPVGKFQPVTGVGGSVDSVLTQGLKGLAMSVVDRTKT
jgi:excinuclease UvrABC ATPase subunit